MNITPVHSFRDDLPARLTDIAYQALLRHGLRQSFLDIELELWHDIRESFRDPAIEARALEGARS